MNLDKADALEEIFALEDACQSIQYDLNRGIVKLEHIPFPAGWKPRTGSILYDIPDNYRQEQPRAFMPARMSYRGTKPMIMLMSHKPPAGFEESAWAEHCIHKMHDWDARRHTLVTMTRMIKDSLKKPNSNDPWKE